MTFRIVMENPGGELDSRNAKDGVEAIKMLAQLIAECGELADGDVFRIIDDEAE